MIFIGERINTGFKDINQAVTNKDPAPLKEWAKKQAAAGADFLDVNLGAVSADPADMCWMIETVQEAVETNICIDTNKPNILSEAIKACRPGMLINSTTAADEKLDAMMPVAAEHDASIIGLVMDESGTPMIESMTTSRVEGFFVWRDLTQIFFSLSFSYCLIVGRFPPVVSRIKQ